MNDQDRQAIAEAWRKWLLKFIPAMLIIAVTAIWLSFSSIMLALIAWLSMQLLYQRYVNKRSWRSIIWGVHARKD